MSKKGSGCFVPEPFFFAAGFVREQSLAEIVDQGRFTGRF